MPQPKRSTSSSSSSRSRSSPAKKKPAARKKPAASTRSASRSTTASRSTASTQSAAAERAVEAATEAETNLTQGLSTLRDAIAKLAPGNVVVISRERLQEAFDEAVRRGRVTRGDAEGLVNEVLSLGRRQTEGVLGEIEQLLERGRKQLEEARKRADTAADRVRRSTPADRVVRAADRARRTVGVGPSFPILGYDDLTAAQITDRLGELSPPELRKVRDYERRHANRKSVLEAIERALA
jgi:polyhydroxyalkanoate synthesis regulator phasin